MKKHHFGSTTQRVAQLTIATMRNGDVTA